MKRNLYQQQQKSWRTQNFLGHLRLAISNSHVSCFNRINFIITVWWNLVVHLSLVFFIITNAGIYWNYRQIILFCPRTGKLSIEGPNYCPVHSALEKLRVCWSVHSGVQNFWGMSDFPSVHILLCKRKQICDSRIGKTMKMLESVGVIHKGRPHKFGNSKQTSTFG